MENEKPRLARLTAIITQLQSRKMLTARELASRHEVSIRTIYRDIQTLIRSGIPIITEEGRGYSLMDDFHLSPVAFTEEEANAIITAEHILRHNKDQSFIHAFESAATKIRAILRHGQKQKTELLTERIQIRNTGVGQITFPRSSSNLTLIQKAITDYRLLELYYQSLEGEQTQRLIEPFALYSTQGNWIMVAYCRTRKDWRSFRLDHIQSVKTGASFEPHNITLEEYFELCRQKYLNTPDIPLAQPTDSFAVNSKNLIMKTVTKQAFKIVGMGIRTTNENGQAMKDLGELWGNFQPAEVAAKIPNRVSDTFYGVYTNYESDHNRPYDALIGFEVSDFNNVPEGMVAKQMEGGTFALITAKGDMRKGEPIAKAWNDINQKDLARAFTNDFEVYDQRAANPADAEVDILVALK